MYLSDYYSTIYHIAFEWAANRPVELPMSLAPLPLSFEEWTKKVLKGAVCVQEARLLAAIICYARWKCCSWGSDWTVAEIALCAGCVGRTPDGLGLWRCGYGNKQPACPIQTCSWNSDYLCDDSCTGLGLIFKGHHASFYVDVLTEARAFGVEDEVRAARLDAEYPIFPEELFGRWEYVTQACRKKGLGWDYNTDPDYWYFYLGDYFDHMDLEYWLHGRGEDIPQ